LFFKTDKYAAQFAWTGDVKIHNYNWAPRSAVCTARPTFGLFDICINLKKHNSVSWVYVTSGHLYINLDTWTHLIGHVPNVDTIYWIRFKLDTHHSFDYHKNTRTFGYCANAHHSFEHPANAYSSFEHDVNKHCLFEHII